MPKFFDSHAHIQFAAFDKDRQKAISQALNAGIWMVNVGTQKDTSKKAVEIANQYPEGVWATVGLHPIHADKSYYDPAEIGDGKGFVSRGEDFDASCYKKLAQDPKVVAIGECGLDYAAFVREQSGRQQKRASAESVKGGEGGLSEEEIEYKKDKQKEIFIKQIQLANEIKKPLMIHCREAFDDLIKILNPQSNILNFPPGIIHFFSGVNEQAKKLLEMGFMFSFGGVITFTQAYDEIIKLLPLENILLETDAPYVTPVPYRGKRNESLYVIEVAKKLAEIKNISCEKLAEQTFNNALRVFGILRSLTS